MAEKKGTLGEVSEYVKKVTPQIDLAIQLVGEFQELLEASLASPGPQVSADVVKELYNRSDKINEIVQLGIPKIPVQEVSLPILLRNDVLTKNAVSVLREKQSLGRAAIDVTGNLSRLIALVSSGTPGYSYTQERILKACEDLRGEKGTSIKNALQALKDGLAGAEARLINFEM